MSVGGWIISVLALLLDVVAVSFCISLLIVEPLRKLGRRHRERDRGAAQAGINV